MVEMALMLPWLVFLFVGILDIGFYSYAAICTQNAARTVALQLSQIKPGTDTLADLNAAACQPALGELNGLPNMARITSCAAQGAASASDPVAVWVLQLSCTSSPECADCNSTVCALTAPPPPQSIQAWVTYLGPQMVPIPGVLTGKLALTRSAEIRVIQE